MNIHPLFVHFPIGIFAAYTLFELMPLVIRSLRTATWIRPAKIWLVVLGVLSLLLVFPTGDMAADLLDKNSEAVYIVETHELFASLAFALYALIAFSYILIEHIGGRLQLPNFLSRLLYLFQRLVPLARFCVESQFRFVLLGVGVVLITITGGLGAAMVYGPNVEPLVTLIYNILVR